MAAQPGDVPMQLPRLEELARHYLEEMKLVQPQGPYHLLGFSFGGLVAFEMANQLAACGERVALLAMLDTGLAGMKSGRKLLPFRSILGNLLRRGEKGLLRLVAERIGFLADPSRRDANYYPQRYTPRPDRACGRGYTPRCVYRGKVTFFEAAGGDSLFFRREPSGHAWRQLLGERVEVYRIPGGHFDMCRAPNVELLAARVRACMDGTVEGAPGAEAAGLSAAGSDDSGSGSLELPAMEGGCG